MAARAEGRHQHISKPRLEAICDHSFLTKGVLKR
jgi:hypothetical protein